MRRRLLGFIGVVGALYAGVVGVTWAAQRTLMYPAPPNVVEPRARGAELLRIPGRDGRTVHALHRPAPPGAPTVVHFHGNGEQLADQSWLVAELGRRGLGVFAVEYPGYGLSRGTTTTEDHVYEDAESALKHLEGSLGVARDRVVLHGQSLGTGVAAEMARRGLGARLVLISPYTSMLDMARRVVPIVPVGLILKDRYDTASKTPSLDLPALVVHGGMDTLIPVAMGRKIASLLPRAELLVVEGGGHNDLFAVDGDAILDRIASFARS